MSLNDADPKTKDDEPPRDYFELLRLAVTKPQISKLHSGGIDVTFDNGEHHFCITIEPSGHWELFYRNRTTEHAQLTHGSEMCDPTRREAEESFDCRTIAR